MIRIRRNPQRTNRPAGVLNGREQKLAEQAMRKLADAQRHVFLVRRSMRRRKSNGHVHQMEDLRTKLNFASQQLAHIHEEMEQGTQSLARDCPNFTSTHS